MQRRSCALLTILAGLLLSPPAWACLNHYGKKNVLGEPIAPEEQRENFHYYISRLQDHHEHDAIVKGPPPEAPAAGADFTVRNDYAVALVRRGESPKAVEILESIENAHPGEYIVAANLGTAYELSGNLEKAHHWIDEGIRRNPKAHEGTEWLHLLILDARMALARDPDWTAAHRVLALDFGGDIMPQKPSTWPAGSDGAEGVIRALTYQLGERLAFVSPPDALVAGMIADLADLLALYRSVDHAIPVYELALRYKPAHPERVQSRLDSSLRIRHEEAREAQKRLSSGETWRLTGFGAIALGVLALYIALRWPRKPA